MNKSTSSHALRSQYIEGDTVGASGSMLRAVLIDGRATLLDIHIILVIMHLIRGSSLIRIWVAGRITALTRAFYVEAQALRVVARLTLLTVISVSERVGGRRVQHIQATIEQLDSLYDIIC